MDSLDFEDVLASIWQLLVRGKADRRSAFHTPTVATVGSDGLPHQRTMVLRAVDPTQGMLRFHTDIRSHKVSDLAANNVVSVLAYDAKSKVQVRLTGTAEVEQDGPTAGAAWANTSPSSRRAYLVEPGPGTKVDQPMSGLGEKWEGLVPSLEDSEAGRGPFAVMIVTLNRLEWLTLAASGHRRVVFDRVNGEWRGQWLIP
jgi:pyridoxamine 5'-phosphate oxidase